MTDLHDQTPAPPDAPVSRHHRNDEDASGSHPVRLLILVGLLGFLFLRSGWALPVVILGVVLMIFLHELGHYLAAKWGGMKVTEFFIGFGPKIWSFQKGETEYGLKVIPAGAYVKIIGMNNLDEVAPGDEDRTYREKSFPKRLLVAVAGSGMHFAQALVLLFVLYAFVGVPGGGSLTDTDLQAWRINDVAEDTAAEDAGLLEGDRIRALDGQPVSSYEAFRDRIASIPGEDVVLTVERGGEQETVPVTIGEHPTKADTGLLGIRPAAIPVTVGPIAAVGESVTGFWDQTTATIGFLGNFFTPSGISSFAGDVADGRNTPAVETGSESGEGSSGSLDETRLISIVGAVAIGADLTENGMLGFLLFFVMINITIGIINLIPLLPLDGGHVVVAVYERIREFARPEGERYHVDFARLIPVVYTVFILLVMLGAAAIYNDIVDPVSL